MVTIDFGNGTVVRRTLHGNVATYVCTADGHVLDILPGIYEPTTYIDRLQQLNLVCEMMAQSAGDVGDVEGLLRGYHRRQLESLESGGAPEVGVMDREDLTSGEALAKDTELNEIVRRKSIHKHLMERSLVRPNDVKNWLYRDVLHADLDDPYLGLGKVLFDNYPFDDSVFE